MSITRYGTGEVRLVWRLLIILALFVALAVLLRFIPISLYTAFLASSGMAEDEALASAKAIVFEDPVWSTAIGVLNGLMSLPLVWLLIRVIERRSFQWKTVGLDWKRNSLSALALGALLALLMYFADKVISQPFGSSLPSVNEVLAGLSVAIVRWMPPPERPCTSIGQNHQRYVAPLKAPPWRILAPSLGVHQSRGTPVLQWAGKGALLSIASFRRAIHLPLPCQPSTIFYPTPRRCAEPSQGKSTTGTATSVGCT